MIIRKLDASGDWQFGKGLSDYATNEQAVEENIRTRLLSWVGDCFFALTEGVDWKSRLDFGQKANLLDEVKSVIIRSFGVVGVNSATLEFDGPTRKVTITYNIQTIFSQSFQAVVEQAAGATGS